MELLKTKSIQNIIFLICFFSFTCSPVHNSMDFKLDLKLYAFGEFPNLAIVTRLKNNSESDFCLLGLEGYNDVFIKKETNDDSVWQDYSNIFYLRNLPLPKFPPNQFDESNFFSLSQNLEKYPDLIEFYKHLEKAIQTHYDVDDAEYWQLTSYSIFQNAVFINAGEEWRDTLNISPYYSRYPDYTLKFSRQCQDKINIYDGSVITFDSVFHKWNNELDVVIPDNFNGYKLIYRDIAIKDEIIIEPSYK